MPGHDQVGLDNSASAAGERECAAIRHADYSRKHTQHDQQGADHSGPDASLRPVVRVSRFHHHQSRNGRDGRRSLGPDADGAGTATPRTGVPRAAGLALCGGTMTVPLMGACTCAGVISTWRGAGKISRARS
jgi:hypothetical protein